MSASLTNSKYLVGTSESVIYKHRVIDLKELFSSKSYVMSNVVGLPMATLDSLHKLAEAISSDANFFNTSVVAIGLNISFHIC